VARLPRPCSDSLGRLARRDRNDDVPETQVPAATPDGFQELDPELDPAELYPGTLLTAKSLQLGGFRRIGATGFEPATFRPPAERATRLRHAPKSSGRPESNRRRELGRLLCYQLHHGRLGVDYRSAGPAHPAVAALHPPRVASGGLVPGSGASPGGPCRAWRGGTRSHASEIDAFAGNLIRVPRARGRVRASHRASPPVARTRARAGSGESPPRAGAPRR
jgi:hypothetical protein